MSITEKILLFLYRLYFNSLAHLNLNLSSKQLIGIFSYPRKRVVRKKEIAIISEARQTEISVNGLNLKMYHWGEGEKIALLIHGWESNAGSLGKFVEPLRDLGYRVLAFDAPAHGASPGKKSNLIYFKEAMKTVIEDYGIPHLCIGHSLGANTIIHGAFELKIPLEKVILISPLDRLMNVFEMYRDILRLPERVFKAFLDRFGRETGYDLESLHFHNLAEKSLIKKALILHDVDDKMTTFQNAESLAKNWSRAKLEAIEKSGHYSILWKDGVIAKAINFIEN